MNRILVKLENIFLSRKFFTLILSALLLVYGYLPAEAFLAIAGAYMGILGLLDWRSLGTQSRPTPSRSTSEDEPTAS